MGEFTGKSTPCLRQSLTRFEYSTQVEQGENVILLVLKMNLYKTYK